MDEARLIEIARRFRKLEDHLTILNAFVAECQRNSWWPRRSKRDDEEWQYVMEDSETFSDACRDDMNAMQEFIRKAKNL